MRLNLVMTIKGEDSLAKKFEDACADNPKLHMDFIHAFGHSIVLALRIKPEDKITIDSFRMFASAEPETPPQAEPEKPKEEEKKIET